MKDKTNAELRDIINSWSREDTSRDAEIPYEINQAIIELLNRSLRADYKY